MENVPKSLKTAVAVATILIPMLTIVGQYALYGYRIESLENRVDRLEIRAQTSGDDLSKVKEDVSWIRSALGGKNHD